MSDQKNTNRYGDSRAWALGIAIGVAIGVGLGIALDSIGAGLALGMGIGVIFGIAFQPGAFGIRRDDEEPRSMRTVAATRTDSRRSR